MRRVKMVLAVAVLMLTMVAATAVPATADIFNANGCDINGNNCDFNGNTCDNNNGFLDAFFWNLFGDGSLFGNNCDPTNNGGVFNGSDQSSSSGDISQGFSTS